MGIFKKTIKYSKPSTEIDNKIKDLDEGLKKIKSTLSEQKFSEEEVDEILSEQIVDIENWKEIFDEETVSEYEQQIDEIRDRHNDLIKVQGSIEYVKNKEVTEIFTELYQGEVERVVDTYISKYSNDIIDLREDLFHEIKKKPVVDLRVLEEKINLLTLKYNQLSEGLLNEPSTGLEDPITFEQLKKHYQLLVGRLQEQLSTLGGGGEVRLQYLDDIVGIATNASAYDGKFLKYNHSLKKFEFVTVSGGGGGGISLTDLSVTTNSVGTAALSYNNSNGVFTYTPPSFVGYATEGYVDNAVENISAQTLTVAGVSTFNEDVQFKGANTNARWDHSTSDLILFDNTRLEFGSNKDFEIWHGGAHTYLKNSAGDLRIRGDKILLKRADDTERYLEANVNNEVKLFFNGNEKFATTNTGAVITGVCSATSFSGSGANLTNLPNTGIGTTGSVNTTGIITASNFVGDGSGLTGITASGTGVVVQEEGSNIGTASTINFIGSNVTAALSGGIANVTISGGISNVVEDTSPQLGGNLDVNGKDITGTGNVNLTGVITATSFSGYLATTNLTGTITNVQLAGSIANAKLENSIIAIGGVTLNLGDTDATPAFDLSDATNYPYTSLTGITTEIVGDTTPQLGGNLDVNSKDITGTGNVNLTGVVTATSFTGNGNDIVHSTWTLGANGSSHYTFTGPGGLSATDDPKIYLARGQTYEFVNNSGGSHPFQIQQSNGSVYNTGVTNNNASSGTIRFEVPFSAPNTLQYKCTNHSSMGNTIIVYPDISP